MNTTVQHFSKPSTKQAQKIGLIHQTANDYDMSYSEVEHIYNAWKDKGLFYEKLEEYIKERAETNN